MTKIRQTKCGQHDKIWMSKELNTVLFVVAKSTVESGSRQKVAQGLDPNHGLRIATVVRRVTCY